MSDSPAIADWLALTKLAPPAPRPGLLARPRLFAALERAVAACPLTLISAPAGSGKTTLLVDWLAERRGPPAFHVAWVSLDAEDNDPARFFAAVGVGLRRAGLGDLPLPDGGAPDLLRPWFTRLINALLAEDGPPYLLILDDLHWIDDPAIFAALDQAVERMPARMRLVAATRHDPPLGLARLRVRGRVAEVHLRDLRFTADETARWLNTALRLDIPAAQIAPLVERTEGWAAGISLLASSLEQIPAPADRAAFLEDVRRTDRTIFEFLAEEVLNRQDPFVRMFLLETAVLPTLTPALCRAVTGRADVEVVLDTLYRRNLFLVEIGARRATADDPEETLPLAGGPPAAPPAYRYHDLFREFLRDRLRRELPDWPARLYRRAAAAEPDPLRRVHLYLSGELWPEAARAIGAAGESLVRAGAFALLQRWIDGLPADLRSDDPRLLLLAGICAWETYRLDAGRALLERALALFEARGDETGRAMALARLALAAHQTGDAAAAREFAARALALPLAPALQVQLRAIRSLDLIQFDNWPMVLDDLDRVVALIDGEHDMERRGRLIAGLQHYMPGPLTPLPGALARFERIERLLVEQAATQATGALRIYLLIVRIYIHLERGQWDAALAGCDELYRLGEELGVQAWQVISVGGVPPICLAARGDLDGAEVALTQLFVWIDRIPREIVIQRAPYLFWRARVRWLQGRHDEVRDLHEEIVALIREDTPPLIAAIPPLLAGLIAIAERRYDDAGRVLRQAAAIQDNKPFSTVFSDAYQLLAYAVLMGGNPDEALAILEPLLARHEREDTPGRLMWEGPIAVALMRLAVERGCHAAFAGRVLRLLAPSAAPPTRPVALPGGQEALSSRELEVLRLLAAGASNAAIAEQLIISPHTAKRHVANILGKLGASTRTEAAARARDLGLI